MFLTDISILGVLLVAMLTVGSAVLLYLCDRRSTVSAAKSMAVGAVQLCLMGLYMKGIYAVDSWLLHLLWLLLMTVVMARLSVRKSLVTDRRTFLSMAVALLSGSVVMTCSLLLCFPAVPSRMLFVPAATVVLSGMYGSLQRALLAFTRSMMHTADHRLYLLANGATHIESLMPSVRRALRAALLPHTRKMASPLLVTMPMFFCGLLLAGASPVFAAVATLLVMAAQLAASVLATVVMLWLNDRLTARAGKP